MKDEKKIEGANSKIQTGFGFIDLFRSFLLMTVIALFAGSCTKDENQVDLEVDPLKVAGINEVIPANLADSIEVNPVVSVTFKPGTDLSKVTATTLTLKKGSANVPGKVSVSGTTAIFTPEADLTSNTEYTATVRTGQSDDSDDSESHAYSWKFKTGKHHRNNSLYVVTTDPLKDATDVPVNAALTVTFSQEMTSNMINSTSIRLTKGTLPVEGSLSFSGNTAVFKPSSSLSPGNVYTVKVTIGSWHQDDEDKSGNVYNWSFTTGGEGNDVISPSVVSVVPSDNALAAGTGSNYVVTFSEPMNPATITATNITLKQGAVSVAGSVTYSGVTATFTPSSALSANTVYTGTVTQGVKDVAGNAMTANFTSKFTTAAIVDAAAPTIISVTPAKNAASVPVDSKLTVTFSETMNTTTINSTTFILKQGTNAVTGIVTYTGTSATFTPASSLTGNTVYTATVTTGAKDVSGNALAVNYNWSFTTIATVTMLSFATDVVPVLNLCNKCHTHPWTTSSVASTFYTNLVNGGYVNPTSPTTSKIYVKLSSGHPGGTTISTADKNKILTWMNQGSKNN